MEFINASDLPLSGPMAENHGIIVLQDGKLRYMSLADFQNYMASASIDTDPTLSVGGVAADAAVTGAAIKAARPSNLLDNSDFRNPVNTTGFTGGAPSADNVFVIDKWKTQQNATKNIEIGFSDSGLNIRVSTGLAGIAQVIPKPKTGVTFAAKVNGEIVSVYSENGVDESVKTAKNVLLYVEWLEGTLQVIIRNTGDEANEYTIEWAALYEGDYSAYKLPAYQPRGYSVEAAACGAAGGGLSMELLWENASVTSDFANQTLSMDLSGYSLVKIIARVAKNNPYEEISEIGVSCSGYIRNVSVIDDANYKFAIKSRAMTVTTTGINFDNCKEVNYRDTAATTNRYMIPYKIYGIKGVIA